jgi:hypothetical protein
MQITIELLHDHALKLLQDLEKMSIIRLMPLVELAQPNLPIRKSRFSGHISPSVG